MPENPKSPERRPLTKSELEPFMLWLFNETGTHCQVEAWRKAKEKPTARAAAAADEE